jgi:hypothetical protein
MKRFGVVLLTALALVGPADAMSGDDHLADLDQLIGKEVLLTDANVGGQAMTARRFELEGLPSKSLTKELTARLSVISSRTATWSPNRQNAKGYNC